MFLQKLVRLCISGGVIGSAIATVAPSSALEAHCTCENKHPEAGYTWKCNSGGTGCVAGAYYCFVWCS